MRGRGTAGQALLEFALVAPVILGVLFAALAGLFYVTEVSSVVGATESAARIAASAGTSPGGTADDLVARRLPPLLEPGLPGTVVTYYVAPQCPAAVEGPGRLAVCTGGGLGAVSGEPVVSVRIYGHLPALLPGFPALPVDERSVIHPLTFHR